MDTFLAELKINFHWLIFSEASLGEELAAAVGYAHSIHGNPELDHENIDKLTIW